MAERGAQAVRRHPWLVLSAWASSVLLSVLVWQVVVVEVVYRGPAGFWVLTLAQLPMLLYGSVMTWAVWMRVREEKDGVAVIGGQMDGRVLTPGLTPDVQVVMSGDVYTPGFDAAGRPALFYDGEAP